MRRPILISGETIRFAKKSLLTTTMWFGIAALATAVAALPADAQAKRKSAAKQVEDPIPDPDNGQPMTLIISLNQQKLDIYRGTTHIISTPVSTGMRGYTTKAGVFSIMEKKRHHRSNLYSGAPMPWMQRLTWSGTALHAGVLPGYPASHGCIRLPFSFAPKLFAITTVGDNAVVARDRVAPVLIEHAALFQPLPQPDPPIMAKEAKPQQSSLGNKPAAMGQPVVLARAEVSGVTTDVPPAMKVAPGQKRSAINHAANSEDTRTHAIDPSAVPAATPMQSTAAVLIEDTVIDTAETAEQPAPESPALAAMIPAVAMAPANVERPAEPAPVLSPIALKLGAGTKAAAIEAAEPRSSPPLRILLTRRTQRDRILDMQHQLAAMGHLDGQNFDGTLGGQTVKAIRAFQKEHGLTQNGAFKDDLLKLVYHIAGKEQPPPMGHLYVRQEFGKLFDLPVSFRDPDKPLGTHLFTALKFAPEDTKIQWMTVNLQGDNPATVLDRLMIPDEVRRKISQLLTPGSSFIVGDLAINSGNLPKGADFVVWDRDAQSGVQSANVIPESSSRPRKRRQQVVRPQNNFFGFQQRRLQNRSRGNQGWAW